MVGTDHDGDGQTGDNTRPFQVHSCYPGGVRSYHCLLRVEDVVGNTMLVDDGTLAMAPSASLPATAPENRRRRRHVRFDLGLRRPAPRLAPRHPFFVRCGGRERGLATTA